MNAATTKRREFAIEVVERLKSNGYQALFAGGCVRDLLLNLEPADFDVATDARPEQVQPLFRRTCEVGMSFGVIRVIGPPESGDVEVATFRSDGAYIDGRRPESVAFSSAEEDAGRRDFTINGMFFDPTTERIIDYVGGRADLERMILRAIGDPWARFREDKLRLLRAIRFAARFNMTIDEATWTAIRAMAPEVSVVSVERIAQELRKILTHFRRAEGVKLARESGLLAAILPELSGLDESARERRERILARLPVDSSFSLSLAALLKGVDSPKLAERVGRRLKLTNDEIDATRRLLVEWPAIAAPGDQRESTLKRTLALPEASDLLDLAEAEALADGTSLAAVESCRAYRRDEPDGPINPPPLLNGNDLIALGWRPGPGFASLLDGVRTAQLDREISTKAEAVEWMERNASAR